MAVHLPYDPAIVPCPKCGAWKWEVDQRSHNGVRFESSYAVETVTASLLRCLECAHEIDLRDAQAVLVGMD